MNNVYPKCLLCGEIPKNGLYDGFRLSGKFICSTCEEHIIMADIHSLAYERNVRHVRKLLYG